MIEPGKKVTLPLPTYLVDYLERSDESDTCKRNDFWRLYDGIKEFICAYQWLGRVPGAEMHTLTEDEYDDAMDGAAVQPDGGFDIDDTAPFIDCNLIELESPFTVVEIPDWALSYLVNGDATGLTDEEFEDVKDFEEQYEYVSEVPGAERSFSWSPQFGDASDCIDCIVRERPEEQEESPWWFGDGGDLGTFFIETFDSLERGGESCQVRAFEGDLDSEMGEWRAVSSAEYGGDGTMRLESDGWTLEIPDFNRVFSAAFRGGENIHLGMVRSVCCGTPAKRWVFLNFGSETPHVAKRLGLAH